MSESNFEPPETEGEIRADARAALTSIIRSEIASRRMNLKAPPGSPMPNSYTQGHLDALRDLDSFLAGLQP
jgi:hypothetical protein